MDTKVDQNKENDTISNCLFLSFNAPGIPQHIPLSKTSVNTAVKHQTLALTSPEHLNCRSKGF